MQAYAGVTAILKRNTKAVSTHLMPRVLHSLGYIAKIICKPLLDSAQTNGN